MDGQEWESYEKSYYERSYDVYFKLFSTSRHYLFYWDSVQPDTPDKIDQPAEIKAQVGEYGDFRIDRIIKRHPRNTLATFTPRYKKTVGSFLIDLLDFSEKNGMCPMIKDSSRECNRSCSYYPCNGLCSMREAISLPAHEDINSQKTEEYIIKHRLSSEEARDLRKVNEFMRRAKTEDALLAFFEDQKFPTELSHLSRIILATYHGTLLNPANIGNFETLLGEFFYEIQYYTDFARKALDYLMYPKKREAKNLFNEVITTGNLHNLRHQIMLRTYIGSCGPEIKSLQLYSVNNLADACLSDFNFLYEAIENNNLSVKKCPVCGKFFIPPKRSDQMCCDRTSPFDKAKTCRKYHTDVQSKLKDDVAEKINGIAARIRKQNNKALLDAFTKERADWKDYVKKGRKSEKDRKVWIEEWDKKSRIYKNKQSKY